jgi:hypothetical protein
VEFSPEDAGRSEIDFLCRVLEAVIDAGARTLNIPDTVGYAMPHQFGSLISQLRERIPNADKAVFSVHCHNDLGLAVANSLAAVRNGARQVECTINGLGERAGNAALEEIVMAVRTRQDLFGCDTRLDTTQIVNCSRLVSGITGFPVQPNKAIVGANAFAHESGIHQDGVLKHRETYEIMRAQDVGWTQNRMVLGKHSGPQRLPRGWRAGHDLRQRGGAQRWPSAASRTWRTRSTRSSTRTCRPWSPTPRWTPPTSASSWCRCGSAPRPARRRTPRWCSASTARRARRGHRRRPGGRHLPRHRVHRQQRHHAEALLGQRHHQRHRRQGEVTVRLEKGGTDRQRRRRRHRHRHRLRQGLHQRREQDHAAARAGASADICNVRSS